MSERLTILLDSPCAGGYPKELTAVGSHWLAVDELDRLPSPAYVSFWRAPAGFCLSPRHSWVGIIHRTPEAVGAGIHIVERLEVTPGCTKTYLLVEE